MRSLPPDERATMLAELVGERRNRRHRPGRGFEALRYRFEVVSDYGAFRDLQRHRMLTVQWQTLGPELGAGVPEELEAGRRRRRLPRGARALARPSTSGSSTLGRPELAPYALCLGYRIRYVLDMNAREAMHLIELRSGREGHPAYRAVAHALHAEIARVHPVGGGRDDASSTATPSRGSSGSCPRSARTRSRPPRPSDQLAGSATSAPQNG